MRNDAHARADRRRRGLLGVFVTMLIGSLLIMVSPASAAPTVGGGGTFTYNETTPAVNIGANLTVAGGTSYAGQYIDFAVGSAGLTEFLSLQTDGAPVTTNGVVSIVGTDVYLGNVEGETVANAATVGVDAAGMVCFYTTATTHLIVDVSAAYSPGSGTGELQWMQPARLLDSRLGDVKVQGGSIVELVVAGHAGLRRVPRRWHSMSRWNRLTGRDSSRCSRAESRCRRHPISISSQDRRSRTRYWPRSVWAARCASTCPQPHT